MAKERQTVALVLHQIKDQPWSELLVQDFRAALAGAPWIDVLVADPEGSADRQHQILRDLLARGLGALVVLPIDRVAVRPALERYRAAGVPVIAVENDPGAPELTRAVIVPDNRSCGRKIGEFFAEVTGGDGDLVEVSGPGSTTTTTERSAGFREAITGTRLRIVETIVADWMARVARERFREVLARLRRIDGVFAQNDEMACGAWEAAVEAGRAEEMLITGIDALRGERGLKMVIQGRLAATLINPTPGPAAGEAVLAILRGEPFIVRTVRGTSLLRSNERVRAWSVGRDRPA